MPTDSSLYLAIICCLVVVSFCVVMWRSVGIIANMSGGRMRANDRERADYMRIVERLVEKNSADSEDRRWSYLVNTHSNERSEEDRQKQMSERSSIRNNASWRTGETGETGSENQEISVAEYLAE